MKTKMREHQQASARTSKQRSDNINKHLQEHEKYYVVTSLMLLRLRSFGEQQYSCSSTDFGILSLERLENRTPPAPVLWPLWGPGGGGARGGGV